MAKVQLFSIKKVRNNGKTYKKCWCVYLHITFYYISQNKAKITWTRGKWFMSSKWIWMLLWKKIIALASFLLLKKYVFWKVVEFPSHSNFNLMFFFNCNTIVSVFSFLNNK